MRRKFYTFRYLITNTEIQMTIFDILVNKETLIKDMLIDLLESKKSIWNNGIKKYIFTGIESYNDEIFYLKFARESLNTIFVEDESDITRTEVVEARYIYIIIDTNNQIILVEDKKAIFQDFLRSAKLLETYFTEKIKEYNYHVNIYPLATKNTFWQSVEKAEKIYQLTLKLNSPNMAFFANRSTQRILRVIQEEVNNDELDLTFRNSEGKLDVNRNGIGTWVDYIREVGGKYFMKYKDEEEIKTISSKTDIFNTEIEIDDTIDDDTKMKIQAKLNKISNIETRE